MFLVFFFKQKTAYDMRISDWSSDVCSSDLLDRVSLHVEPKEFVIVVGQSGAGKSTLLKLLTREERQTSGKIIIGGIEIGRASCRERSVSVRVDIGGRRIIKKKENNKHEQRNHDKKHSK